MLRTRLDLDAKDLADQLAALPDTQQRAVALAVVRCAAEQIHLQEPLVDAAVQMLAQGIYKDERTTDALEKLAESYDVQYLDAHERFEAGQEDDTAWRELFRRFVVVTAVRQAFNDDAFEAAAESIYDAGAAIGFDDPRALLHSIRTD